MVVILIVISVKALPERIITQEKDTEQFKEVKKILYEGLEGVALNILTGREMQKPTVVQNRIYS